MSNADYRSLPSVDRLLADGVNVTGWDNLSTGQERFLEGAGQHLRPLHQGCHLIEQCGVVGHAQPSGLGRLLQPVRADAALRALVNAPDTP